MTKHAHTAGPLTAIKNGSSYWEIQSEVHGQIGDCCASEFIYIDGEQLPRAEATKIAEANARIFAAAPEMFEALHDLLTRPTDAAARIRARAALSKATGEPLRALAEDAE